MPQAFYEQEFMCKFLENASAVFKNISRRLDEFTIYPEADKRYQMGVDLGRHEDFTVITITDKHTLKSQIIERFNKIDWDLQISKIEATARRFNNAEIWLDSTGIGDPVYALLIGKGLNVQAFKFTEKSREQLLNNLAILIEQNKLTIAKNEFLENELKSFQYVLRGERVKAEVPEGYHDDCVMSLALSVWGLYEPLPSPKSQAEVIILPIQKYD